MSKMARGMMLTIIIVVLLGLLFALAESSVIAVPLIASLGGMFVFLGLWVEKDAEKEERKYPSIFGRAVRLVKLKSEIGWWILMAGIFVEIVVAIGFAVREGWVASKMADEIAKMDPRKQPIFSMEANAVFFVRGTTSFVQRLPSYDSAFFGSGWLHLVSSKTNRPQALLVGDKPDVGRIGADTRIALRFHMPAGSARMAAGWLTVEDADCWDRIWLDPAFFLQENSEVIRGWAWIRVNSTVEKEYHIPAQIFRLMDSPTLVGVLTNSAKRDHASQ
jgi:hypothetical protein